MTEAFKAVLLDLDGTLVDSVPGIHQALQATLNECAGLSCAIEDVRLWVGNGPRKLVARALMALGSDLNVRTVLTVFNQHYARTVFNGALYPGVPEGLQTLHDAGLKLACITNKPSAFTLPYLDHLGIAAYFTTVICADQVERPKPHPESLSLACDRLQVTVDQAVMVGDSANDLKPANTLGMRCVAVAYGYDQDQPLGNYHPLHIAPSFPEVVTVILSDPRF
ncbi:MAG: HAD-IA family hydrolase [Natronospirillum sp.]